MFEVTVAARPLQQFTELIGAAKVQALIEQAAVIRARLGAQAIWNISSTATGGGVAELLRALLQYVRGEDINARWLVIDGSPEFFRVTKRLHNALHASVGDGSALGPEQRAIYERVMSENLVGIDALVRPGDVVICHDPQTAGLVPHLMKKGARVVWRCHIGLEDPQTELGWRFLRPYIEKVPFAVFSRSAYAPSWMEPQRAIELMPTIDPFSTKNQVMDEASIRAILARVGLVEGAGPGAPTYRRSDGSIGRVDRSAEVLRLGGPPRWDTPVVVQISRWDAMKDPVGVMEGFLRLARPDLPRGAELVLAGPTIGSVADDPEAPEVFGALERRWRALPDAVRRSARVHLALLPMQDAEENAAVVNALQRHATVIVQKSLQEGFGLTVTEAMWKQRPVVASAIGGIVEQIRDGVDGLLVRQPADLDAFAAVLDRVLRDPELGTRLGLAGAVRVRDHFLSTSGLEHWAKLIAAVLGVA